MNIFQDYKQRGKKRRTSVEKKFQLENCEPLTIEIMCTPLVLQMS